MSDLSANRPPPERRSLIDRAIRFSLENKLVVFLAVAAIVLWGLTVAPFDWDLGPLPRRPVPTDAIPDIGENQQIVFTGWPGRSPQDVEDQITYPLTTSLLGTSGVRTVRAVSMFGFSTVYIIFNERVDFDTSRNRLLVKLNSLPAGTLPEGVRPALGPEATALGQIFWYTLEGHDPDGYVVGGWDLDELRTIQDWQVRFHLLAATDRDKNKPIAEVASVGGFVKEYQIDVDPDAMRAQGATLDDVFKAVRMSNVDVGARTIEINRVEYVIRGLGFIRKLSDIEDTVVKVRENVPICVKDVAHVSLGPALRRGALDKEGTEAVGGVVVVRFGENPLTAIQAVKDKIEEIKPQLPVRVLVDYTKTARSAIEAFARENGFDAYAGTELDQEKWLTWLRTHPDDRPEWVTTSKVTIVPFYDRTGLIHETLDTLNVALTGEILVTIIVVVVLVLHLRSSLLISSALPLAVLMCFIGMKLFGVDANIVALSGIAIAIGTIVDMSIIVSENTLKHLAAAPPEASRLEVVYRAASEVGGAVVTAVLTTIVGFLPVFTMTGAEGKLFRPLAWTKTFALIASVVVALTLVPPAAHILVAGRLSSRLLKRILLALLVVAGLIAGVTFAWWAGLILVLLGAYHLLADFLPEKLRRFGPWIASAAAVLFVGVLLVRHWLPLGPASGFPRNALFVVGLIGGMLVFFRLFQWAYVPVLRLCLAAKPVFLLVPVVLVLLGVAVWLGLDTVFAFLPGTVRETAVWRRMSAELPGLGREFMPDLDEGSFLYMPTTMPHASIGEALDVLQKQDVALSRIPEVDSVVGKIGRAETPLDPAPISMIETVVNYKSEYAPDGNGNLVRQWRPHIRSKDDIWREIVDAARIPGTTSAPKLQPIAARIVMLQSGMRAPMGVKIKGSNLEDIERVGLQVETLLREVPGVEPSAVNADRIVGKPYLEIHFDRGALARFGISIRGIQDVIEVAIGGRGITTTVEGRERYTVRVRYLRELRDSIETIGRILVPAPDGTQIPLTQLGEIRYVRGPQSIKSEDTFLIGYVLFDKQPGFAEVDVVETCDGYLKQKRESGELVVPDTVSSISFAGTYESQLRAQRTLKLVVPVALFIIFMILYFQFGSVATTLLVFSGILVAWAGGFILIWFYGQGWFLNFEVFDVSMRHLFQVHPINLSVAVWVGFLALFGIASDNGVVIATYLDQSFAARRPSSRKEIREATVAAAARRIRPCLMTSATTLLALLPVLTSTGRGSDVMVPMAIPTFGGMLVVLVSVFVVPVLYCAVKELKLALGLGRVGAPPRP
ncbi:MAG TPA: efflux RND transporter permease subunit [Planctomycetota bacterium]|nr:efflux RND transporter permease subunit [Planctomycetota bacterium]